MLSRQVATVSCLFIVLGLPGCNNAPKVKTIPAAGTVKYKGLPVSGAVVSFLTTTDSGKNASGVTDSEGKFTLKTYIGGEKTQDGALEGSYTVTVAMPTTAERPFGTPAGVDPSTVSPDEMKAMREKMTSQYGTGPGQQAPDAQKKDALEANASSLPAKYAGADTTPFKDYAVKAVQKDEKNDFELTLSDD